jgi:hypothetical protein
VALSEFDRQFPKLHRDRRAPSPCTTPLEGTICIHHRDLSEFFTVEV